LGQIKGSPIYPQNSTEKGNGRRQAFSCAAWQKELETKENNCNPFQGKGRPEQRRNGEFLVPPKRGAKGSSIISANEVPAEGWVKGEMIKSGYHQEKGWDHRELGGLSSFMAKLGSSA